MAGEYTCAMCGEIFEKGWPDEEAAAEAYELLGVDDVSRSDVDVICDDCFQVLTCADDLLPWRLSLCQGALVMAKFDEAPCLRRATVVEANSGTVMIALENSDKLYSIGRGLVWPRAA
jgi:hypothetical protein